MQTLRIDASREVERIGESMRQSLARVLRRRGVVLGLSGGIDSSVTAALAVRALGRNGSFGVLMPERDSRPETRQLSRQVAEFLGIDWVEEEITGVLEALGCYTRFETAVREAVPEFRSGWRSKLVISRGARSGRIQLLLDRRRSPRTVNPSGPAFPSARTLRLSRRRTSSSASARRWSTITPTV